MRLLPSLRQKKRYVVVEVLSDQKFSYTEIKDSIEQALATFWGEFGKAKANLLFLKEQFNYPQQRFMLKVHHLFTDELKAALTLSKKIKNTSIILRSVITSGTIKTAGSYLSEK